MIDDIIQEATEAEEQGRDAGYAVGELLRIIKEQKAEIRDLKRKLIDEQKSVEKIAVKYFAREEELERQKTEIDILIRKKEALRDEVAEKQAEIERLHKENKEHKAILEAINDEFNPLPFETDFADFGKTVFTSREDAVKALEGEDK